MLLCKELWVDEYKGKFVLKYKPQQSSGSNPFLFHQFAHGAPVPTRVFEAPEPKEKSFTSVRNHKGLKLRHLDPHSSPELPSTDHYKEFIKLQYHH
jgi:hypothetical protein